MIKGRHTYFAISQRILRTTLLFVLPLGIFISTQVSASIGTPKIDQENEVYVAVDSWKRIPLPPGEWRVVGSAEVGGFFRKMTVVTMINLDQDSPFRLVVLRYNIGQQTLNTDDCKAKRQGPAVAHWQQSFEKPTRVDTCSYFLSMPRLKAQLNGEWKGSDRWGAVVASIPEDYANDLPDDGVLLEAEVTSPSAGFVQVATIIRGNPTRSTIDETTEQLSKGWAGAAPAEQKLIHWRQEYVRMMRRAFFERDMPKSDALAFGWGGTAEASGRVPADRPWTEQPAVLSSLFKGNNEAARPENPGSGKDSSRTNTNTVAAVTPPLNIPSSTASPSTVSPTVIESDKKNQDRQTSRVQLATPGKSSTNAQRPAEEDARMREAKQEGNLIAESSATESRERPSAGLITGTRKAIVIGNDTYSTIPKLKNARADARALGLTLSRLGYTVTTHIDQDEKGMKRALRDFMRTISGGDEVVFFYAGHGVQIAGVNYLLPVDMRADDERTVRDEAISLQRILDDMSEAKARLTVAIIDACRDNPFSGSGRSIGGRGLSPTTAATGQVILFSAGSGQQALDSVGPNDSSKNGLFTRTLLKHINRPGETIDRVMRTVRNEVALTAKSVGHEQVPALYDQVIGDFYFSPKR